MNYLKYSGVRLATEDPDMVDMITDVAGGLLIKDYESGCSILKFLLRKS